MSFHARLSSFVLVAAVLVSPAPAAKQPRVEGDFSFRLHDLEGNPVSFDDERFRDKVVLVDLWGTWCSPCITMIPTFADLQSRYGDRGLVILSIAFERIDDAGERRAHLRSFAAGHHVNYLVLDGGSIGDFGEALPMMRDVSGFPIEVVIGRDGKVVSCRNGYTYKKKWARRLERELTELLGLQPEPSR